MFIQSIKNYFKNLQYFFTPLGALALGIVFGLSVLIPGTAAALSALTDDVRMILDGASIDLEALKNSFLASVRELDWSEPIAALGTALSQDWLSRTLNGCLNALLGDTQEYAARIDEAIAIFCGKVAVYALVLAFFAALGFAGGFIFTKKLVRKNIAKAAFWKRLIAGAVDLIFTFVLAVLCAWAISMRGALALVAAAALLLLIGTVSLFEAYLIHAKKRIPLAEIVNVKNIALLFLGDIAIFLLALAFTVLLTALTNSAVGIFIGMAFFEIAIIVIGLNAEAYVKSRAQNAPSLPLLDK